MSTQRGNGSRTRAQKHKNRTVFKNDLHDKTPMQMRLNAMHVSTVCQHCKGVIEWKIKYKKYKPLSQAKTCTRCQQRNILKAYHVLCRDCARETRQCAKCLKSADEVEIEPPKPTPLEEQKLKVEMNRLIKSFSERKRRAFLRYMEKGKREESQEKDAEATNEETNASENIKNVEVKQQQRVPHTRDALLKKIEELKLIEEDDEEYDFDDSDDGDLSDEDGDSDNLTDEST